MKLTRDRYKNAAGGGKEFMEFMRNKTKANIMGKEGDKCDH